MQALRFRSSYQVDIVDGTKLFLLNDDQSVVIDNPVTATVAALIDGARTPVDIVLALSRDLGPQQVFVELGKLQRAGFVVDSPASGDPLSSYVESWGGTWESFTARADALTVGVLDLCGSDVVHHLAQVTAPMGVVTRAVGDAFNGSAGDDLVVVVVDDYLTPGLRALNTTFHARGQQWVLAKPWGREVWVGPRFVPGVTGCWECAADRLTANRQVERYVAGKRGLPLPPVKPVGLLPGATGITAGLIATEVFALAAGLPGTLVGTMRCLDLGGLDTTTHSLVPRPQCPVSGDPQATLRGTSTVSLAHEPATHRRDGGYRVCSPAQTFARLEHHISPYLGAVSRLDRSSVGAEGITYAFTAGHNFGMMQDNMDLLKSNMRGQSGGKGRTEIQAKVSGICEAIERYCGVWTPDVPAVRSTWVGLERRAIHPAEILQFSTTQYANRREWNDDPRHRLHRIPEPFDEQRVVDFTPAWSLAKKEEVLVPAGLVWFGAPDLTSHMYAVTDSNGGAAGNTMAEAVLQGLCEVYERDAVALWWYNRIPRPGVDLDSFGDGYTDLLREYYDAMERDIWVLDLRNDLKMPVFAAFSRRRHEIQDLMVGFGAHPDPDIALFRALTELNQFLPFVIDRDEQGNTIYGTPDAATIDWCRTAKVESDTWVAPCALAASVTRADLDRLVPASLDAIVDECVVELAGAGIETVVVNQSRPDIELSVAKVLTPGLRHFWRRTAPGRLYDVPVRLGWLDQPLAEDEINPVGVFF